MSSTDLRSDRLQQHRKLLERATRADDAARALAAGDALRREPLERELVVLRGEREAHLESEELAEFVCSPLGEPEFHSHLECTLAEVRAMDGCLHAVVWQRPERRYQFSTLWRDREAVTRWVENEFHRETLMPGFRRWCIDGWFGEFLLDTDHQRARRCPACGRWSQGQPGWAEAEPPACRHCGGALGASADSGATRREAPG